MGRRLPRRGLSTILAIACLVALGCALAGPRPLGVSSDQRAVLGRVDILRPSVAQAWVDVLREDGTFSYRLRVDVGRGDFAIALPPGRYRVASVRLFNDRPSGDLYTLRELRVSFDVARDAAATYVGTLRLTSGLGDWLEVSIHDEYAATVATLRTRYSDLPQTVTRALMTSP